jgi:hypothetical protein
MVLSFKVVLVPWSLSPALWSTPMASTLLQQSGCLQLAADSLLHP